MTTTATKKVPRRMQPPKPAQTRADPLFARVKDLLGFGSALAALAEHAPERMTLSQAVFFLFAAGADLSGRPTTFTAIKEEAGPRLNRSMHTTYKVLLDEGRKRAGKREEGLGWLRREDNPADNREKYLRLTAEGREVIRELLAEVENSRKLLEQRVEPKA